MVRSIAYIPRSDSATEIPFERFLPVYPAGVARTWLERNIPKGSWILDPIGASPQLALEAAAAGYRVLVACNNPVTAFELRMLASTPNREELSSVVSELAELKKGSDKLESTIQSLYLTRCSSCGNEIQATAFLWRKDESIPYARIYQCPHCSDSGEHPVTDEDIQRLQPLQRSEPLHRARALERVLSSKSDGRENVEEALNVYLSRPLYVLFTLINKLEGMSLSPRRRELLEALLLPVLDAGNSIWAFPEERERPRQLSIPSVFYEKNLWMELEKAMDLWASESRQIKLSTWPELPEGYGICLFPGRMRELAQKSPLEGNLKALVCVFPRPSQAYWTLCSLWASWLWGREKAIGFSSVLERRRFDWFWHTSALHSALSPAGVFAGDNVPVFGILPEPAPGLVNAVVESTSICGFKLTGCAVKNADENIQMEWKTGSANREFKPVNIQKASREAIRDLLQEIGEPTEFIEIHTAAMCALAQLNAFPPSIQQLTYEKAGEIHSTLSELQADKDFLRRLDATAQDPESGLWWLTQPDSCQTPMADRLEIELLAWLQKEGAIPVNDLDDRINQRFPGFLTPPDALIQHCMESYATLNTENQTWVLKENEKEEIRNKDIQEIRTYIELLASRFKVKCEGNNPAFWSKGSGEKARIYRIYISATAVIDRDTITQGADDFETIFILPGSRAGLLKI